MTKPLDRAVTTGLLFPDYVRLLNQAARVETVPVRRCYFCDAEESDLVRMRSMDEWRCADITGGCGRRLVKRG